MGATELGVNAPDRDIAVLPVGHGKRADPDGRGQREEPQLVRDVLQHAAIKTIEAGTGEDGVRLAKERHPDLVLMDICCRGIDGISALGAPRRSGDAPPIPVIAVTASGDDPRPQEDQWPPASTATRGKPIKVKDFLERSRDARPSGRNVAALMPEKILVVDDVPVNVKLLATSAREGLRGPPPPRAAPRRSRRSQGPARACCSTS